MDSRRRFIAGVSRLLGSNMVVVIVQALQFILLARALGVSQFGEIAAANALAGVLIPLSGIGMGNVMLMEVSRAVASGKLWVGNALVVTYLSGLVLVAGGIAAASIIYGANISLWVVAGVLLVELLLARTATLAAQYFSAQEVFRKAASSTLSMACVRLVATSALFTGWVPRTSLAWVSMLVILALAVAVFYGIYLRRSANGLACTYHSIKDKIPMGIAFATGIGAKAIYTDADKIMLGHFGTAQALGAYASAYRLTTMAFMPVRALLDASAARFFRAGERGVGDSVSLSIRLLKVSVPYGLLVAAGMYLFAPVVPYVLGSSFSSAPDVLRILCLLPFIQSIHYVLSDALTGAGLQGLRTRIQLFVVAVYLIAGYLAIPVAGWQGAAYVCIGSEALLAVLISGAVWFVHKRESARKETST